MKVIITENQLDKLEQKLNELVNKYIDSYITGFLNRESFDSFILFANESDYDNVIIEYDSEDGRLYIDKELVIQIADTFNLSPLNVQLKINNWFVNHENVFPKYVDTPRISTHDISY